MENVPQVENSTPGLGRHCESAGALKIEYKLPLGTVYEMYAKLGGILCFGLGPSPELFRGYTSIPESQAFQIRDVQRAPATWTGDPGWDGRTGIRLGES